MSFFTHQENARKTTLRIVVLFITGIILLPVIFALGIDYFENGYFPQSFNDLPWETIEILLGGTLIVIVPIALYKFFQFKTGGHIIAEELGGRWIDPENPYNFQETQILNIVQEMALAANIPAPHIYILDQENTINAFAAGYTLNDAVIGITKGALDVLTREELMALIGHELSHILNEDMRINLRFTALIYGMYALMTLAYYILISFRGGNRQRSSNKKDSSSGMILVFSLVFMIIGWVLALWGNIMQASVSRQREFLADASSAQFTRMPHAVASLLKKIGGSIEGSTIHTANNKAYSHMFFANSAKQLFSTHPPLEQRILQMEPHWDGNYIQPAPLYNNMHTDNYFATNQTQTPIYTNQNDPFNNNQHDPFV